MIFTRSQGLAQGRVQYVPGTVNGCISEQMISNQGLTLRTDTHLHGKPKPSSFFFFSSFIDVQLIDDVVIISAVQQSDSDVYTHPSILFQILFPCRLSRNIAQRCLCWTAGSFLFFQVVAPFFPVPSRFHWIPSQLMPDSRTIRHALCSTQALMMDAWIWL